MDKPDVAMLLALLAILISLASVRYARIMAVNDTLRMKRKAPIFEVLLQPVKGQDDRKLVEITARNIEVVGVRLVRIRAKSRKVRFGPANLPYDQRIDLAATTLDVALDWQLTPNGSPQTEFGYSPTHTFHLHVHGLTDASQLVVDWEWADGSPK